MESRTYPLTAPLDRSVRNSWVACFPRYFVRDRCNHPVDQYGRFDWVAAVASAEQTLYLEWPDWKRAWNSDPFWSFGVLGSAVRFDLEPALIPQAGLPRWLGVPPLCQFRAETVLVLHRNGSHLTIHTEGNPDSVWRDLKRAKPQARQQVGDLPPFRTVMSLAAYRKAFVACKQAIRQGEVYELNLTRPFRAQAAGLPPPTDLLTQLATRSPVPFATAFRSEVGSVVSVSPERLLLIEPGGRLVTQPIKGTRKRTSWHMLDGLRSRPLQASVDLQAENVMIADLARNDLNRVCRPGTVEVPHLFEVQAFRKLFHSVTTVTGELSQQQTGFDALEALFPPGSMTGAPKVRALQLIDQLEVCEREWYAGSAGWLDPNGFGDWSVLIRSLMFDADFEHVGFHVGGAITWDSDLESEWEEGLLKASQFVGQRLG